MDNVNSVALLIHLPLLCMLLKYGMPWFLFHRFGLTNLSVARARAMHAANIDI